MDRLMSLPAYWKVFIALAVLTLVEVWAATAPASKVLIASALIALAVSKAALVAMYYMHLRYDRKLLSYVAVAPFLISIVMVIIILSDSTLKHRLP